MKVFISIVGRPERIQGLAGKRPLWSLTSKQTVSTSAINTTNMAPYTYQGIQLTKLYISLDISTNYSCIFYKKFAMM